MPRSMNLRLLPFIQQRIHTGCLLTDSHNQSSLPIYKLKPYVPGGSFYPAL
jgi:hypothetical protein